MVEPDLENLCRRGVAGDVTPQLPVGLIRAYDHRERIPAN